jgi:hypothetical protein
MMRLAVFVVYAVADYVALVLTPDTIGYDVLAMVIAYSAGAAEGSES